MNNTSVPTATPVPSAIIWNLGSLVFLAAAGFALNIVIARFYGPQTLGAFNICYGIFIFLSQFGAFGIQFSVLQAIAANEPSDRATRGDIVRSGLLAVVFTSTAATLAGLLITPFLPRMFDVPDIATSWLMMLPGLWAFSVNKFLFGVVNGAQRMRTFATLQAARYILLMAALGGVMLLGVPGYCLPAIFTISEVALAVLLAMHTRGDVDYDFRLSSSEWRKKHLAFGAKSFLSGAILELNTRVDVLMIGAMIGSTQAGIYSAALLVVEGVAQCVFAIRNVVNPIIAAKLAVADHLSLLAFSRKLFLGFTFFMLIVATIAYLIYPIYVDIALGGGDFKESTLSAGILLAGLALTAGGQCFGMVLAMGGKPALHTFYVMAVLLVNLILNIALVPTFGIEGSAFATASSYVAAAVGAIVLARLSLGVRLVV